MRDDFADDNGAGTSVLDEVRGALTAGAELFEGHVGFLSHPVGSFEVRPAIVFLTWTRLGGHHVENWSCRTSSTLCWVCGLILCFTFVAFLARLLFHCSEKIIVDDLTQFDSVFLHVVW